MFSKKAIVVSTAAGSGARKAVKDKTKQKIEKATTKIANSNPGK